MTCVKTQVWKGSGPRCEDDDDGEVCSAPPGLLSSSFGCGGFSSGDYSCVIHHYLVWVWHLHCRLLLWRVLLLALCRARSRWPCHSILKMPSSYFHKPFQITVGPVTRGSGKNSEELCVHFRVVPPLSKGGAVASPSKPGGPGLKVTCSGDEKKKRLCFCQ